MQNRMPNIVAIILLLALVIGTWWAADYTMKSIPTDPPARISHEPDSWADNFVMVQTNELGMPANRLEGIRMRHYPDDDSYEVDQAIATGQQVDSPITIGTSDMATLDEDGNRIVMRGNAHVHRLPSPNHDVFDVTSDVLTLYIEQDTVETDLPAKVISGSHVLLGKGMHYDNKTRQLQVFSSSDATLSGQKHIQDENDNN